MAADAVGANAEGEMTAWSTNREWPRRTAVLAALALALVALWAVWNRDAVMAWKAGMSPLVYFSAMALLPAIGATVTPFFIVAGATFGVEVGLLGSAFAMAVNAWICHTLATGPLRDAARRLMNRLGHRLPEVETGRDALRLTVMAQLTPGVPAFLKNYVAGVAGAPLSVFFPVVMIFRLAYAAPLVLLGESIFDHDLDRATVVGATVLVLLVAVGLAYRRIKRT